MLQSLITYDLNYSIFYYSTNALFKDTKHVAIDGQICFYGQLFPMLSNHEGVFHGLYVP